MQIKSTGRYQARPEVRTVIDAQGRRHVWLGRQLQVSQGQLSKVISGTKTIPEPQARLCAALLGWDFAMLFDLLSGNQNTHKRKDDAA